MSIPASSISFSRKGPRSFSRVYCSPGRPASPPAGHGEVSVFDAAEDFLDVLCGIELGLVGELEDLHGALSLGCGGNGVWRECGKRRAKARGRSF
jgi:hypothetical protein